MLSILLSEKKKSYSDVIGHKQKVKETTEVAQASAGPREAKLNLRKSENVGNFQRIFQTVN